MQFDEVSKDESEDDILLRKKLFEEKYPRVSGMPQPSRNYLKNTPWENTYKLKKNALTSVKEKNEVLESLLHNSRTKVLSRLERKALFKICKYVVPDKFRRQLWLRASGASAMMNL